MTSDLLHWCVCLDTQSCPTLCDPMDCFLPASVHGDSPGQEYRSGWPCPPPGDLPNPGIEARSPALQADSLLSEPRRKPMSTTVGSLSLLQGIVPTQESNWGLLHCMQNLYHLSYQGSPLRHYQLTNTHQQNLENTEKHKIKNKIISLTLLCTQSLSHV